MRFEVTLRYSSVKTAWKPLGALWIRLWEAPHRSLTTIRTPGARQRLTALLLMMAAGTIPSRSRTKRCKRQNENRERGCDVDRARTRVRYRRHYTYSTIKAPDKREVGGSSPPRPTIQITSKYAAILTFPLFGASPQKTVLSTVFQLYVWPEVTTLKA